MAEILHFPGKDEAPRVETGEKAMHQAAALLALTVSDLLVDRDHRDGRLKAIDDAAHRIKLAQLCLKLALLVERMKEPVP